MKNLILVAAGLTLIGLSMPLTTPKVDELPAPETSEPKITAIVITRELPASNLTPAAELPATAATRINTLNTTAKPKLHSWANPEELRAWVLLKVNGSGNIFFAPQGKAIDCSDYALALQADAEADGYRLSFQIIEPHNYNNIFQDSRIPDYTLHAINLAIVAGEAYYIEPQTGEVVLAALLD
jgi:hypothetical protein